MQEFLSDDVRTHLSFVLQESGGHCVQSER